MTKSEISQKISQLERDIADAEKRKAEAEKNIRQLNALNASCNDYQAEFESARTARKIKREDINQISG
jgi:predicted  nucleic acid-binding Zn-ribbon protein